MNSEARAALLAHYDQERRDLPWRGETDPYRILVSEVMLQQTRVQTVIDYYGRWLEQFPDVPSLAAAGEDSVLKAWEGLGYYRRARNLHRAAKVVRERSGGSLPGDFDGLRELPGVGEYTAGAVASIAFGEAVPAVDGNVRRVFSRFYDHPDPKPAWLRERARGLVHAARPGDWNQALMELGATVCTPRSPSCDVCPIGAWCSARAAGTQMERPGSVTRAAVAEATFVLAVFEREDGSVLIERRPERGLLGGMWAFPESAVGSPESAVEGEERVVPGFQALGEPLSSMASARSLVPVGAAQALPRVDHLFSHLRATYLPYRVPVRLDDSELPPESPGEWVIPTGPIDVALPRAQARVMELIAGEPAEAG